MGMFKKIRDHYVTDIEVVTASAGTWERESDTLGGALSSVGGKTKKIRVFHGGTRKDGTYVVLVDGDVEIRIERKSRSTMRVTFSKDGQDAYVECLLSLSIGVPVTIEDPNGCPMTFRRFRHATFDLEDLSERANA